MSTQQQVSTKSPARVWVVAGASRGIGEQYVAQVGSCMCAVDCSATTLTIVVQQTWFPQLSMRFRRLPRCALAYKMCVSSLRHHVQVLKAGDAVVAAARRPEQSPGLARLKAQYGAALQLVRLDVNDGASLEVRTDNGLSARWWLGRSSIKPVAMSTPEQGTATCDRLGRSGTDFLPAGYASLGGS